MESLLIAAFLAAAPSALPAETPAAAALDVRCFQLMAVLAEDEDPRIRSVGRVAAQYFLGRIDAAMPGADLGEAAAAATGDARDRLLSRCSEAMQAGGRDFRSIGEALAPSERPAA